MDRNYIKNLIGSKRYKLATDQNTNVQLQLEEKTKPLTEYDIIDIVNLHQVFEEERQKSKTYRFNGKLNIYTSNVLSVDATNSMWDPLFYGNPATTPNNWVMQVTYPSTMDYKYTIQARTTSGTIVSDAFRGFQYEELGTIVSNSVTLLTVKGVQSHNMSVGDYIYLYSNSSFSPIQGFHKISELGINGDNQKRDLTLETIVDLTSVPLGFGNFMRIFEPSFDDLRFDSPLTLSTVTATDISGSTFGSYLVGEDRYLMINSTTPHNLLINDFVDIRTGASSLLLNGLWRVYNIINTTSFVIKLDMGIAKGVTLTPSPQPLWRRLDGTPSEYYIRKFEVLTSNDYSVYPCAFSSGVYSDVSDVTIGTANDTWLFQFDRDISVERIVDNRGGSISELYYTIIKRSGKNPYDWSNVTADWDFNYSDIDTTNGLEDISKWNTSGIGSVEKSSPRTETIDSNGDIQPTEGSKYIGDFIDYNSREIKERTISEVVHRFGLNSSPFAEGYYYKPFKKLQIRQHSNVIETAQANEIMIDIPGNYETYADGSIAWRDLLTIGYFEEGDNGVEYPFVNGSQYFYFNHNLFVRRQKPTNQINQDDARVSINKKDEC